MEAVSEIIAELLIKNNLASKVLPGQGFGQWPVYKGKYDDNPDNILCVYDIDSFTTGRIHRTGESLGAVGYQVLVRAKSYRDAQRKSSEISSFFDSVRRDEIPVYDTLYLVQGIHQTNRASYVGPDANGRTLFTMSGESTYYKVV